MTTDLSWSHVPSLMRASIRVLAVCRPGAQRPGSVLWKDPLTCSPVVQMPSAPPQWRQGPRAFVRSSPGPVEPGLIILCDILLAPLSLPRSRR